MAVAFNMVRMRVRPDREGDFLAAAGDPDLGPGQRAACLVRTGEQCYCLLGEWDGEGALEAARPSLEAELDRLRPFLEGEDAEVLSGAVVARARPRIEDGDCRSC